MAIVVRSVDVAGRRDRAGGGRELDLVGTLVLYEYSLSTGGSISYDPWYIVHHPIKCSNNLIVSECEICLFERYLC